MEPKHYDTGEDAVDTHSWATDTKYDRAKALRTALVYSDHDCRNNHRVGVMEDFCRICADAYEMNDHELLVKYQGKVTV